MKLSELKKLIEEAVSSQMSAVVEQQQTRMTPEQLQAMAGATPPQSEEAKKKAAAAALKNAPAQTSGQHAAASQKIKDAADAGLVPLVEEEDVMASKKATPPPIPSKDPKRARLDAIAREVAAKREKAAAQHAPENKALDQHAFGLANKHGAEELSENHKSNSITLSSSELLEMINEAVQEVLQEKKKAKKWNFEKKKGEEKADKDDKSDKKDTGDKKKKVSPFPLKKK